jgi:hypothetical protein
VNIGPKKKKQRQKVASTAANPALKFLQDKPKKTKKKQA